MSSVYYCGSIRMNPEVEEEICDPMFERGYPYKIPKVYLEGYGESYFPQWCFGWDDDSVIAVRDKLLVRYTRSSFTELLAKNESGEIVWMDGRTAPYSNCWEGEYLNENRGAQEYTVEEFNLKNYTKKTYKMVLDEEKLLDNSDLASLSNFLDKEALDDHFYIKDGVLIRYFGESNHIIIPEGVREIGNNAFKGCLKVDSIKIPKTVEKISCVGLDVCLVKHVEVEVDNPKYYTKDGLLIDRETQTLVWAYAGNVIPDDGSVKTIGTNAFCNREDIKTIIIPDVVSAIDSDAFSYCFSLEEVKMPDVFVGDAQHIFGAYLVKDGDKYRLEGGENAKFRGFSF